MAKNKRRSGGKSSRRPSSKPPKTKTVWYRGGTQF